MDENTKEIKSVTFRLQIILTILAIVAPIFYLIGLSFYQGKLAAYGVNSDIFPISVQEIYVYGYSAIFYLLFSITDLFIITKDYLSSPPGLYQLIIIVSIITLVVYFYFKFDASNKIKSIFKKIKIFEKFWYFIHWKNNNLSKAIGIVSLVTYFIFMFFIFLAAGAIIWILPLLMGYQPGKLEADEKIDYYLKNGCTTIENKKWGNCTILQSKDGQILYEGILVASTEKRIAFFTKNGSVIMNIPEGSLIMKKLKP